MCECLINSSSNKREVQIRVPCKLTVARVIFRSLSTNIIVTFVNHARLFLHNSVTMIATFPHVCDVILAGFTQGFDNKSVTKNFNLYGYKFVVA